MLRSSVGNSIAVGRSYTLRWECTPADASVKIEITHNNLPEPFLVEALSTHGNLPGLHANDFEWTVPDSLDVMSGYRMRVSSTVDDTLYDDSLSFQILDAQGRAAGAGRRLQIQDDMIDQAEDECSNGRMLFAFIFLLLAAFCALMAFQVNKAKKESQMKSFANEGTEHPSRHASFFYAHAMYLSVPPFSFAARIALCVSVDMLSLLAKITSDV